MKKWGVALWVAWVLACAGNGPTSSLGDEALRLHNAGRSAEAAELFLQAADEPGISAASRDQQLRNAGNAYYEAGNFRAAHRTYRTVAETGVQGSAYQVACHADQLVLEGDVAGAIVILEEATERLPPAHALSNALGLLLVGLHGEEFADFERALPHNEVAFELAPDPYTRFLLAINLAGLGRNTEAVAHLVEVERAQPDDPFFPVVRERIEAAQASAPGAPVLMFDLVPVTQIRVSPDDSGQPPP